MNLGMTKEEKDAFAKARDYFTAYFNGETLPSDSYGIQELEKKWDYEKKRKRVKAKLYQRKIKQKDTIKKREDALSVLMNLRTVDTCVSCANNSSEYSYKVWCLYLKDKDIDSEMVCDKFKMKGEL